MLRLGLRAPDALGTSERNHYLANAPILQVRKLIPREQDECICSAGRQGQCQVTAGHFWGPSGQQKQMQGGQSPEPHQSGAQFLDSHITLSRNN